LKGYNLLFILFGGAMLTTVKATIDKAFIAFEWRQSAPYLRRAGLRSALLATAMTTTLVATTLTVTTVDAREQWQMQHPEGAPPTGPVGKGYVPPAPGSVPGLVGSGQEAGSGMAPGLRRPLHLMGELMLAASLRQAANSTKLFSRCWSHASEPAQLTGVLGDDISSKNSHAGDLFSVVLTDGHSQNGHELIPRGARIIGKVVMAAPAAGQRTGMSGNVEVGLTTLVFPDGRSTPFTGFIERNPAHTLKKPPTSRGPGMNMSDYKKSVGSMFGSFTSGIGAVRARTNRGKDLLLHEGDVVPVRVTRTIDLTKMSPPTAPPSQPLANPFANSNNNVPGNMPANLPGAAMAPPLYTPNSMNNQAPILPKELPDPF
jgi:hypothetical protein